MIGTLLVEAIRAVLKDPPVTGDAENTRIDSLADAQLALAYGVSLNLQHVRSSHHLSDNGSFAGAVADGIRS